MSKLFNYEADQIHDMVHPDLLTDTTHYVAECKEIILNEVTPNYPKLTEYEKEWLYFANNIYHDGQPVNLEYQTVDVDGYASVENAIPFYYKSASLKGQTLVNLNKVTVKDSSYQVFKDGWQTITTREKNYNFWETGDVSLFKTNTQYLVIIEVEQNNISYDFDLLVGHNVCVFSLSETTGKTHYKSGEVGRKVLTLTTKNNFDGVTCVQRFVTNNTLSVSNETVTYRMMFIEYQEGMENWNIPYFEGMKSVQMPVLTTTGNNLFDGKLESGRYTVKEGVPFADSGAVRTVRIIKVKPSTKYTLSVFGDGQLRNISEYNNGTYVGGIEHYSSTYTFETSAKTNEIHISFQSTDLELKAQLEENLTATSYEPHKSNILTVNEDITLRSNGSVYDELDLLTGELTQRIDENGEVLSQEVVKTVDLNAIIKPYEGTNHYTLSSETIPPQLQLSIPVESTGAQTLNEINQEE